MTDERSPTPPETARESAQETAANGLHAQRDGLQGWTFETTPVVSQESVARHESLLHEFESTRNKMSSGMGLLLGLAFDDAVLTLQDATAAVGRRAQSYRDGETVYVEWPRSGGRRDRRKLSPATRAAIARHAGTAVSVQDWQAAAQWLRERRPDLPPKQIWPAFFADAQTWWQARLTGPAFAHAAGLRPLQLLPRAVLARRASGRPQLAEPSVDDIDDVDRARLLLQTTRARTPAVGTLGDFGKALRSIVNAGGDKASARRQIVEEIDRLLPRAALEGRAQVIVLMAVRYVVWHGGMRGKSLAPRSLAEYLRKPLEALVRALLDKDVHARTHEEWHRVYRDIVEDVQLVPLLQRKKLEALFEAMHRFMVLLGAQPLQRAVSGGAATMPPVAVAVEPHELEVAIRIIWASDYTDEVKEQGELGLRLANWVPMRIEDLWCLRRADVHLDGRPWISIGPRRRDGYGKSPALRRQSDVEGSALLAILQKVYQRRLREKAGEEDVLLGEPGVPDGRHEEAVTTELMNAALREATGNPRASFHDLRHTRISALSEPVFAGEGGDSDVDAMQQVSAAAGHAGPDSSIAYQHCIECALAQQAASARPVAWNAAADLEHPFEDVAEGLVAPEPVRPGPVRLRKPRTASDLTLSERGKLLQWVIDEPLLDAVASICRVSTAVVKTVLAQTCTAFQWAGLADHAQTASVRLQVKLIRGHWSWSRAALQAKHDPIVKAIEVHSAAGRWQEVEAVWGAWLRCQDGVHLSLNHTPAAVRLIAFLLKAGVPEPSLLVVRHDGAPALPPELARWSLASRTVVDRSGRQVHRLQICDAEQLAAEASGPSVSIVGIHWWMLILGSIVLSKGEEK